MQKLTRLFSRWRHALREKFQEARDAGGWWRLLKKKFRETLEESDAPHRIAGGFAAGAFLGVFPTFSFGIFIAPFCARFLRFNPVASLPGVLIASNPITNGPIIVASFFLGTLITNTSLPIPDNLGSLGAILDIFKSLTWMHVVAYLAGNTILSCASALLSYLVMFRLVHWYRSRKIT